MNFLWQSAPSRPKTETSTPRPSARCHRMFNHRNSKLPLDIWYMRQVSYRTHTHIYICILYNHMCVYIYIRLSSVKWNYVYIYIWAIGKTSIEKCDLGSKLSFLGLHYIVLQYILIASSASPGKLHAESLFTPPLQRLKHLWLPCVFFCSAPTVWYGTCQCNCKSQLHHPFSSSETSLNSVVGKKSGWALTATCSMPFIHSTASG